MSKPNVTRVQSATEWTASVHTLHMSKPVMTFVYIVPRNGFLGVMDQMGQMGQVGQVGLLGANLGPSGPTWGSSGPSGPTWGEVGSGGQLRQDSDCFGTYSTHAQTCDDVRVQSATEWSAYILYTCPNLM